MLSGFYSSSAAVFQSSFSCSVLHGSSEVAKQVRNIQVSQCSGQWVLLPLVCTIIVRQAAIQSLDQTGSNHMPCVALFSL